MVFLKFINPFGNTTTNGNGGSGGTTSSSCPRAPSPRIHRSGTSARAVLALNEYSSRTSRKTWFFLTLLLLIFSATTILVLRLDDILMEGDGITDGIQSNSASSVLHRRLKTSRTSESLVIISEDDANETPTQDNVGGVDVAHEHAVDQLLKERERAHEMMEEQKRAFGLGDDMVQDDGGVAVTDDFEASLRHISNSLSVPLQPLQQQGNGNTVNNNVAVHEEDEEERETNDMPNSGEEDLALASPPHEEDLPDPPAALLVEEDASPSSSTVSVVDADSHKPPSPITDPIPSVTVSHTELKKIHTCTYGRLEKTPTLAYVTWIWRYRKGSVEQYADKFWTPSESRLVKLRQAVAMVSDAQQDWSKVATAAALSGYTLCKVDLISSVVIAWQPRIRGDALFFTRHNLESSDGGATTATATMRNLIIEVPHPMFDHTLNQGLYLFSETKARALIFSSSHRCAKSSSNTCTGNEGEPIKSNCQGRSMFHNSDAAHAVQTTFYVVHEQLAHDNPRDLFASVHATKSDEFVVSDGTSNPLSGGDDNAPVVTLAKKLALSLPERKVSLCNHMSSNDQMPPNVVAVSDELVSICGATNVQGRHLNGAKDPCHAIVDVRGSQLKASGRFLHIEQPVALVKPASSKSSKPAMSKALSDALMAATGVLTMIRPLDG